MKETKLDNAEPTLAVSNVVGAISSTVLTELFHSFEEAVMVADTQRRIVYMNSAAEKLFGYTQDELCGKESKVLYAEENEFSEQGRKRYNLNKRVSAESYRVAYRRSGGEPFLGITTGTTMHSANGDVVGLFGVIRPTRSADQSLNALQKIHNITSDIMMTYDKKIESLLSIGLNHFGLKIAILSNIKGDDYTVENCVDLHGELEPLTKFDLSKTYCVHTLNENKPVGFHFVGISKIQNHPCYKDFQLESYIGTPLRLDNKTYGTVNFSSPSPVEPFCKDDYILMEILSDSLSYLLYKKKSEEELEALARVDELTGLPNRRATLERLSYLVDQSRRFSKDLSVLSIDIDHFKNINDTWGHAAGDQVLVKFARVASSLGRKTDFCGRIGGEEFVFVLSGSNVENAQDFGNKLRQCLARETIVLSKGKPINLKISAGVAMLEKHESIESLLARADDAMYKAKQQGRDRVCH